MAIYHFSMKTFSRSKGQSATAAVAYRAGDKIECEREGRVHDYSKKGGVLHSELFLPSDAPSWANDREKLWNGAESAETRKNSTVAREFEVALPCELNEQERIALVRDFAQQIVDRHGCAVDAHLHDDNSRKRQQNHHAHIMLTTRKLEKDGFTKKTRELDVKTSGEVQYWREQWEKTANKHLRNNAIENNKDHYNAIDHRTLAEQGIDRPPTKKLGVHAAALERRGIKTEKGDHNRDVKAYKHKDYSHSEKMLDRYLVEFSNKHNFIVTRLPKVLQEERHKYPALAKYLEKIGIDYETLELKPDSELSGDFDDGDGTNGGGKQKNASETLKTPLTDEEKAKEYKELLAMYDQLSQSQRESIAKTRPDIAKAVNTAQKWVTEQNNQKFRDNLQRRIDKSKGKDYER